MTLKGGRTHDVPVNIIVTCSTTSVYYSENNASWRTLEKTWGGSITYKTVVMPTTFFSTSNTNCPIEGF